MKSEQLLQAIGHISEDLISSAVPKTTTGKGFTVKRAFALAGALLLAIALSIPALAAVDFEPAYQLLYSLSPAIAQRLKPVRLSSEDQGIRLDVISAHISGHEAQIYLALTDLAADRIDQTTDLFDSYGINAPFESVGYAQNVGYDPQARTATFLVTITQQGNQAIAGDKLTFGLRQILGKKHTFDASLPELAMPAPSMAAQTVKPAQVFGGGGEDFDLNTDNFQALRPGNSLLSPTKGVDITALGYVDGKLRVQIQFENVLETDNHGYIYFKDDDGGIIHAETNCAFAMDPEGKARYEEFIFDLSGKDMDSLSPHGNFVTSQSLIRGSWSVTFPLESLR